MIRIPVLFFYVDFNYAHTYLVIAAFRCKYLKTLRKLFIYFFFFFEKQNSVKGHNRFFFRCKDAFLSQRTE